MSQKYIKLRQHDISDCGAACLASISTYYGYQLPIARIRQYASTDKRGTNVLGLIEAAEKIGFTAKGVKGPFENLGKAPLPAIAHVKTDKGLLHFVIVYKVIENHVVIMDPADGEIHHLPHEIFRNMWTGVLVLLVPNNNFKSANETISPSLRFWQLIQPHKSIMLEALLGAALSTILGLSTSIYIQKIVDYVIVDNNGNLLNLLSVSMIIILLLKTCLDSLRGIFVLRTGQKIDVHLILGYYQHLLTLPQKFFDTMRIGEIISRLNDAVKIRSFINEVAIELIVNIFIVLFSFVLLFTFSSTLGWIMTAILPLYGFTYAAVNKLNKKYQRRIMENAAGLESQLVESINSISTIKHFSLENAANIKTEISFIRLLKSVYLSGLNNIFSNNASAFLTALFVIILLWSGTHLVLDQTITPGELMSCYALLMYLTGPMSSLMNFNITIQDALIASDRLFQIIDIEREDSSGDIKLTPELIGDIQFKDVGFRYGSKRQIFESLNLTIPKGKVTAIMGESGSGKSTLASLLQKIYPLTAGHILIGKYDIRDINNNSLREIISIVPQKIDLFVGSVIENIAVGEFEPDVHKITNICLDLKIKDFIDQLPNGLQTQLGENGIGLSGGEKQRIAIARALYKDPEILILDEATSSLDSVAENHVQNVIKLMKDKNKTIILITHQLSSTLIADHVIRLKNGAIVKEK